MLEQKQISEEEIVDAIAEPIAIAVSPINGFEGTKYIQYFPNAKEFVVAYIKDNNEHIYYTGNSITLAAKYYNQIETEFFNG